MLIFNHPHIPAPTLYPIKSLEEIKKTAPNTIVWFDFDFALLQFCQKNSIQCVVTIKNVQQAVYANALGATYLICKMPLAKKVQKIAENYLFDAKVIALIDERVLDNAIEAGIDGVFLTNYPLRKQT